MRRFRIRDEHESAEARARRWTQRGFDIENELRLRYRGHPERALWTARRKERECKQFGFHDAASMWRSIIIRLQIDVEG